MSPDPEASVRLPDRLSLQPAAEFPAVARSFHGIWAGELGEGQRHVLIVERMLDEKRLQLVFATADSSLYGSLGGWWRLAASIDGDRLVFDLPPAWNAAASYRHDGADRLRCDCRYRSGYVQPGTLHRAELATLAADEAWDRFGQTIFYPQPGLRGADGATALLEATLYRPADRASAKLAVFGHGSGIGRDLLRSWREPLVASWLVSCGYAVLVPMRRGRGRSQGDYVEDTHRVDDSGGVVDITPSVEAALEDLQAAIVHARTLPGIDGGPVLQAGQSRGGFLAVIHAGRRPDEVSGVINFAGGWMGGNAAELNTPWFADAGQRSRGEVPQLWLYGARDAYYDEAHVRQNHHAFTAAGGLADLIYHRGEQPQDGHWIRHFPDLWQTKADGFLESLKR